jgi:hypothetical protein
MGVLTYGADVLATVAIAVLVWRRGAARPSHWRADPRGRLSGASALAARPLWGC